ncbi:MULTISPECIES: META domain-containing protein [Pseudomonas]|uniref:Heat shock protein HslJ n=1 Tax=Pseudomonas segetis TaxID=298908 RepID=A0A238ZM56_9PSED|nr:MULTISPECIES: META domain-containing protein [Pseudomonas]SNR84410.1 heat shock protein HslJ [Pseudomonas segetis]
MKALIGISLISASLLGCASDAMKVETDQTYEVEWIGERPLIDYSHLTITLGSDGRAYGSAGCNHWFAAYKLDGDKISFEQAGSTRKMCAPALMEQETRFLQSLPSITRWDFSPTDQLRLWPKEGKPLRLWPVTD